MLTFASLQKTKEDKEEVATVSDERFGVDELFLKQQNNDKWKTQDKKFCVVKKCH